MTTYLPLTETEFNTVINSINGTYKELTEKQYARLAADLRYKLVDGRVVETYKKMVGFNTAICLRNTLLDDIPKGDATMSLQATRTALSLIGREAELDSAWFS